MSEEKKVPSQVEMTSFLENNINDGLTDLEALLPSLGHSEAKRLLMYAMQYPAKDTDVSTDKPEFRQAYSACKRISDALVGLGVEAMMDGMVRNQMEQTTPATEETKEETNG